MNPAIAAHVMHAHYNGSTYWQHTYGDYLRGEALRLEQHRRRLVRIAAQLPRGGRWGDLEQGRI